MAYHFKRRETIPQAARRIGREEIAAIAEQLGRRKGSRDRAIHEARKNVKKARALLRLVGKQMGRRYRLENHVLREAGRTLSELRDRKAAIETFDALRKRYPRELRGPKIDAIRETLLARRMDATELPRILRGIAAQAKAAGKRVRSWPIKDDGFRAIGPGLKKGYGEARAAFAEAQKARLPEDYHNWRKRLKDHWYHVRLIRKFWDEDMRAYEGGLREAETWLGDDHNLALLHDLLADQPEAAAVLRMIGRHQREVRGKADAFGRRVYQEKPREFLKRVHKLWKDR
jgi:CHAD domain-containing protein